MNKYFSILLSLLTTTAIAMESKDDATNNPTSQLRDFTKNFLANKPKDSTAKSSEIINLKIIPSEHDKKIYAQSLKNAPTEIKTAIYNDTTYKRGTRFNWLYLTGEPGMGKSLLAKAIG